MRAVAVHAGDSQMGVGRGVAVTGKMLHGGHHARMARALNVSRDQIADLFRILSERTRVNDWIGGIRVYVGVGKEVPVNAYGAGFLGGDAAEGLGVFELAVSSEGHCVRKVGGAHQARRDSALKVCCEQQRKLGFFLETVEQFGGFIGLGAQEERAIHMNRHGKRADVIFLHSLKPLQVFSALHVKEAGAAPDHENLPDLFFDSKAAERLLGPLVAARGASGSGTGMFVLGKYGQSESQTKEKYREESRHKRNDSRGVGIGSRT